MQTDRWIFVLLVSGSDFEFSLIKTKIIQLEIRWLKTNRQCWFWKHRILVRTYWTIHAYFTYATAFPKSLKNNPIIKNSEHNQESDSKCVSIVTTTSQPNFIFLTESISEIYIFLHNFVHTNAFFHMQYNLNLHLRWCDVTMNNNNERKTTLKNLHLTVKKKLCMHTCMYTLSWRRHDK